MTLQLFAGHTLAVAFAATAAVVPASASRVVVQSAAVSSAAPEHKIYGLVESVNGNTLMITNRAGRTVIVDGNLAHSSVRLYRGRAVVVSGTTDASGVVHAKRVWRTFPDVAHWPADR